MVVSTPLGPARRQVGCGDRAELGDLRRQRRRVALQHEQPDLGEGLVHERRRERRALGAQDALGGGRLGALVGVEELLVQLLARSPADDLDLDVLARARAPRARSSPWRGRGCSPARPCRARTPRRRRPASPARMMSCTASGIVMKKRVMRSSVTVTGPPRAIWRRKIGTTDPEEPRTLPKRTLTYFVAGNRTSSAATAHSASAFDAPMTVAGATALSVETSTNARVPRLAGDPRDDAGGDRVVAHRLHRVGLHEAHVLVRGGVEDDRRAVLGEHLAHPLLLLAVREDGGEGGRVHVAVLQQLALDGEEVVLGVVEADEPPRRRRARSGGTAPRRSSRRRR